MRGVADDDDGDENRAASRQHQNRFFFVQIFPVAVHMSEYGGKLEEISEKKETTTVIRQDILISLKKSR